MLRRTWMMMGAAWLVACGGDTPDDGAEIEADVADVGEGDAGDDTGDAADATDAPDEPIGPPPCVPDTRRCLDSSVPGYEVCSSSQQWERFLCDTGQVCFAGQCQSQICEPFEVESCVDCRNYVGCNAGGTSVGENPVPGDRVCEVVDGVAQLVPAACAITATRCAPGDDDLLQRCDECGTGWVDAERCSEADETHVCDLGACIPQCEFVRKRSTYIGCEYWAVDLDNAMVPGRDGLLDADGKPFAVVVANPSSTLVARVTVSMVDGPVREVEVAPSDLAIISLHHYASEADTEGVPLADLQGTEIKSVAFRVASNLPIVAYQFNPLDNEVVYSNDASLLFPTSTLGTEYWVMTRRQTFDSLKGYVAVAAASPGETEVTVTLPPFSPENPVITLAGANREVTPIEQIPSLRGGESRTFRLRQFQVLNIETNRPGADLSGTRVVATQPVAVFGGAEAANAPNDDSCVYRPSFDDWVCEATRLDENPTPCTNASGDPDITRCSDFVTCCADHIEHQMLPPFAWGRRFNATRSVPRGDEADMWRVLADQDDTTVRLVGLPEDPWPLRDLMPSPARREFTLGRGEWIEFPSPVDFEIVADKRIMVGQFLSAEFAPYPESVGATKPPHSNAGTGDPAFTLVAPIEQYRREYTFLCPAAFEFDYVTITAPTEAEVRLDGELLPVEAFETFGTGAYAVARQRLADGAHRIEANQPVGIMVHGYDSFVSYSFIGGLDLTDLSGGR